MPKTRRSLANKNIVNCVKCENEIKEESDDFIQCDKCMKSFHSQCCGLSRKAFELLLKNEEELFSCYICNEGGGELRKELNTIKTELKKLEKLEKLDQLTESINFMSAKFDEVFKDVAENKKKITEIEKENKKLKTEVQNLKSSVKILNNYRVKNDCVIRGLKVNEGDKAIDAVMGLSKDVGVEIEPSAVEDAYFMRNYNNDDKKTVVVKFSSKINKDKLMSSKCKLKENEKTSDVYVYDFHSKETLNLWNHAKSLKAIGYQHVYVRNENVFCKKNDLAKQQLIRCEDDVDRMLFDATTNKHWKRRSMLQTREVEVEVDTSHGEDGASYVTPS